MEEDVKRFLSISRGYGSGYGSGDGSGDGSGYGSGYGSGDGSGYGRGDGRGYGRGDGRGYGNGDGSGYGRGDGRGLKSFNGKAVYEIDGVQTLIDRVHGNVARGEILKSDLTLTPCWIVKQDDKFAHGETPREAREALLEKLFDYMPEEERLIAFREAHAPGTVYPNTDFFAWHHRLTGSCEMGRRQFALDHGIDVDHGSMTAESFIRLTENAYGSSVIRKLLPLYGMTDA